MNLAGMIPGRKTMLRTIFDPYSDLFLEYIETTKKNDMQTNHYHDTYELFLW